jgi:hypothetical protein
MIDAYYKFISLPDEVRTLNKIKSLNRLDCIEYYNNVDLKYNGFDSFTNKKGQMYIYKTKPDYFINSLYSHKSNWSLTHSNINITSIYLNENKSNLFGYGFPNDKRNLSNGSINPLFPFRNDGYLMKFNNDISELEVYIIREAKSSIKLHYEYLINGSYDKSIQRLKTMSKPYYYYNL